MRKIFTAALLTGFCLLTGCASIVNGTNQPVSVKTLNTQGATCTLRNDKGVWYIPQTPGTVVVHRSFKDLLVQCEKRGFANTQEAVPSKTKAMAFGNLVFGGIIGGGVDVADGAAYDYPTNILLPMHHA